MPLVSLIIWLFGVLLGLNFKFTCRFTCKQIRSKTTSKEGPPRRAFFIFEAVQGYEDNGAVNITVEATGNVIKAVDPWRLKLWSIPALDANTETAS